MKPSSAVNAARNVFKPLGETLKEQVADPIFREGVDELMGFFDKDAPFRGKGTLAQEDLKRAREQKRLSELASKDQQNTQKQIEALKVQYKVSEQQQINEQKPLHQEVQELTVQVVELAKTAGIESKIHLQNTSKKEKVSVLTIKLLRAVIRTLTLKAKEAKSASDLVTQRSNAKRPTGMLAWVSGKQMKIHEQGTLQLQG